MQRYRGRDIYAAIDPNYMVASREAAPQNGRLAQLAEHLVYTERVGGSIPSPPTSLRKRSAAKAATPKPTWAKAGWARLLRLGKPA